MLDKETVYDDEKSSESSDTDKSLLGGVDSILGSDSEIEEKVVAEEAQPVALNRAARRASPRGP